MAEEKKRTKKKLANAAAKQREEVGAAYLEKLDIVYVPLDQIKQNQYNPNRQSPHDFQLLCKSIQEDGFTRPIVVRKGTFEIVDGEHRWRACKALHEQGLVDFSEGIACVLVEMTDAQARIATLKYNRIHGSEDANLAAAVLKEIIEMGATDWAQDSLMLDDVEMKRLTEELAVVETEGMNVDIPADMLGPAGKGLSDQDQSTAIDTSADETRAKQKLLEQAKQQEERQMNAKDANVFRVVAFFTGDEAKIVKSVLEPNVAQSLLQICREEAAATG